jgi:hypothetical protein
VGEATLHPDGTLVLGSMRHRAAFGRGGVRTHKQEGDGATPAGLLPLRRLLYRADRISRPRAAVPAMPLAPHDGWCDDPSHADYNRPVRLPHDGRHEALWRAPCWYKVVRGRRLFSSLRGSADFSYAGGRQQHCYQRLLHARGSNLLYTEEALPKAALLRGPT